MTKQTFKLGDRVRVTAGAFAGQIGTIYALVGNVARPLACVQFPRPVSAIGLGNAEINLAHLTPYRGVPASFDIDAGEQGFAQRVKRQDIRAKAVSTAIQAALAQVGAL